MICSDGLSPVVSFGAIRDALASAVDPGEAVRHLVGLAEAAGAPDNITVIVTDVRTATAGSTAADPVTLGVASAEVFTR